MPFPNFLEKLKEFPIVNSAVNTSTDMYKTMKSSHTVVQTTFNTAEAAIKGAVYIAAPIAEKLKNPIEQVDKTIVKGLEKLEQKIPIVKHEPAEIIGKTKDLVENISCMASSGGSTLKRKANDALKSPAGKYAMETLDVTSAMTDRAIDFAFPPKEGEEELHPHPNVYCEDKVYHVVHTVGTLGIKAGRKVCNAISHHAQPGDTTHECFTSKDHEEQTSPPQSPESRKK